MRVSLKMFTADQGEWTAELATMRTLGIISFLQKLLFDQKKKLTLNEDAVLKKYYLSSETANVAEDISVKAKNENNETIRITEDLAKDPFGAGVKPDFVLTPYTPTGQTDKNRELMLDYGILS